MRVELQVRGSRQRKDWKAFLAEWKDCNRCVLAQNRANLVHVRGVLPCDILFVGEAPGPTEDNLGYPFVGPSGRLLQTWISEAMRQTSFAFAIANTVGCIPLSPEGTVDQPCKQSIATCSSRLQEIVRISAPKAVVLLGRTAGSVWRERMAPLFPLLPYTDLFHPSYVLRCGGLSSSVCHRMITGLSSFIREVMDAHEEEYLKNLWLDEGPEGGSTSQG